MKRMLSTTALAVILACGGSALAQDQQQPGLAQPAAPDGPAEIIWTEDFGTWMSDELIGASVVNESDETLGDVKFLIISLKPAEAATSTDPNALPDATGGMTAATEVGESAGETRVEELAATPETSAPAGEEAFASGPEATEPAGEEEFAATPEAAEPAAEEELAATPEATEPVAPGGDMLAAGQAGAGEAVITDIVIGVGGFLGIGEKRVAIPFDRFGFFVGDNGGRKIVLSASREELEAMPDFVEPGAEAAPAQ